MKRFALGLAAVIFSAGAALAAAPAGTGDTSLGKVWVDQQGMTLYTFDKDAPNKSNCNGDCAAKWPPFMAGADAKDDGDWTIVTRDDGSKMWAYEGKPLYLWVKDSAPGDVTGDGVGGVWHAAKAE